MNQKNSLKLNSYVLTLLAVVFLVSEFIMIPKNSTNINNYIAFLVVILLVIIITGIYYNFSRLIRFNFLITFLFIFDFTFRFKGYDFNALAAFFFNIIFFFFLLLIYGVVLLTQYSNESFNFRYFMKNSLLFLFTLVFCIDLVGIVFHIKELYYFFRYIWDFGFYFLFESTS